MDREIRIGCLLVQAQRWPELRGYVREMEELGFDELWLIDHLRSFPSSGPVLEAWTTLAGIAAVTSRIRIGTLVTAVTYRHPAVVAKQAITVDELSSGRLELGVGAAGSHPDDGRVAGVEPRPASERVERLEEFVDALRSLLEGAGSHEGRYYSSSAYESGGFGVQRPRPPIVVAAQGDRTLRVAGRFGDAWNGIVGPDRGVEFVRRANARIDAYAAEAGRDPAAIRRTVLVHHGLANAGVFSSAEGFWDFVSPYREAGVDGVIVYHPSYPPVREAVSPKRFGEVMQQVLAARG